MAHLRWAVIALQQAERHRSGSQRSLELALTAHIVPELELEILDLTEAPRMKVEPSAAELLEIARATILSEIAPALPEGQRYCALMAANALAIAGRDLAAPDTGAGELARMAALLPGWIPVATRPPRCARPPRASPTDIREGRFDEGEARAAPPRAPAPGGSRAPGREQSARPAPATKGPRRDHRSPLRRARQGRPGHRRLQRAGRELRALPRGPRRRGRGGGAPRSTGWRPSSAKAAPRTSVALDVTDPASVDSAMRRVGELAGPVDILVNNAGVADTKASLEVTESDWRRVLDTNLDGAWRMAQAAAKSMVAAGRGGSIVNIASILGLRQATHLLAYAAAKAALVQVTKSLALEWARHGIRVNAIAPGYVVTEMNRDFFASDPGQAVLKRMPQRRVGDPRDLEGALLLLASGAGAYITGSVVVVDGGHLVNSL